MKAISLWNPWAWLIAHGHKKVETRGWCPPAFILKAGRRIAIHAAKKWDGDLRFLCQSRPFFGSCLPPEAMADLKKFAPVALGNGHLLATCRIACVVPTANVGLLDGTPINGNHKVELRISAQEREFGDYTSGRFAWVLDDVRPIANPPAVAGAQGFFEVDWQEPS
jgi:hypothetical protein